jgi:hypothetical protein
MAHIIDETSCKMRCCNKCDIYRKELQHYKDLEEKGLLVELDERPTKNTKELFYIYDRDIWSIKFEDIGKAIKRRGITKFYTNFAEAEQALADMEK